MLRLRIKAELRRASARWLALTLGVSTFASVYVVSSAAGATSGQRLAVSLAVVCLLAIFLQGIVLGVGLGSEMGGARRLSWMLPPSEEEFGSTLSPSAAPVLGMAAEAERARRLVRRARSAAARARVEWRSAVGHPTKSEVSAVRIRKLADSHTATAADLIRLAEAELASVRTAFDRDIGALERANDGASCALNEVLAHLAALRAIAEAEVTTLESSMTPSTPSGPRRTLDDVQQEAARMELELSASRSRLMELRGS